MAYGNLIVQTATSITGIPIENAEVFVTSADNKKIISYERTNVNGKTKPIRIEAPAKDDTYSPDFKHPYTEVRVYATKESFFNMLIENVQVFAEETSVQYINMLPLPINYKGSDTRTIVITPQDL